MSQTNFQLLLARLVTDPQFREKVRHHGEDLLGPDLTKIERTRLASVARDRGLDITRTLHRGFRLGKLRSMVPLTCALLGSRRLAGEAESYWMHQDCVSFYYISEALEFCEFLEKRIRSGLRIRYLRDVVEYERACLRLQQPGCDSPATISVRFSYDPEMLLTRLAEGIRPRGIPKRPCVLTGSLATDGNAQWIIEECR